MEDSSLNIKDELHRMFSHIYVEKEVRDNIKVSKLLERFSRSVVIYIDRYGQIFNKANQDWQLQKSSRKLILARKHNGLLYPGSALTPNFGSNRFFYNTLVMNCLYDCSYCYLRGLYRSANVVLFVNGDDYKKAVDEELKKGPIYLCLSYDSDLLGFESIFGLVDEWIDFASTRKNLTIEIRTKSASISKISSFKMLNNVIFAWTISPDEVITKFEKLTPPLLKRLQAIKTVSELGGQVRICIDPILFFPGWREAYSALVDKISENLVGVKIRDISLGTFRMSKGYYSQASTQNGDLKIFNVPTVNNGGIITYPEEVKNAQISLLKSRLSLFFDSDKIFEV